MIKFRAIPAIDEDNLKNIDADYDGTFVYGNFIDGDPAFIVGDVVDSIEEGIILAWWVPVKRNTVERCDELPVIPQAVADWIRKCKSNGSFIGDVLCSENRPEQMREWMALTPGTYNFDQQRYSKYQDIVARAWIDGYRLED